MSQMEREVSRRVPAIQAGTRLYSWDSVTVSRIILALALVVGILLRVWQINLLGYNTDEAVYAGQAAAIAGTPVLKDLFPVFRAHPLLFQFVLSLLFRVGFNDLWGRLIAAGVGMGTVYLSYLIAKQLYGNLVGALTGLLMALMPYHVIVSRQVLLDGPMTFFATLTLYLMTRYGASGGKGPWLYAAGAAMGMTVLSKETGIILVGGIYTFLALAHHIRVRIIDLIVAMLVMVLVVAPFPISMMLAGGSGTGKQYLIWQLFRKANHEWNFYPLTVTPAIGILVVLAAILGLLLLRKQNTWSETLLLSWILVPITFFQLWPTKGFQYLLPITPAVASLAARFLVKWVPSAVARLPRGIPLNWISSLVGATVAFSLFFSSWASVQPTNSSSFLAGTGGVPGGRESGAWIQKNVPSGAVLLAIGPSMANLVQFYGRRKAFGLSVSPNPLFRNPSYTPVNNPDLLLRRAEIQYVVWDSFSAERTEFFSEKLMGYVKKYNGRVVHIESVNVKSADGTSIAKPVIVIYEVRP
ncbi:MAG: glycosyltransferase family 39 protein [Anaerolineaceae bacterium]|nr:glycosyltransferase family 39 protein [Anaerolineaceae bacterium]